MKKITSLLMLLVLVVSTPMNSYAASDNSKNRFEYTNQNGDTITIQTLETKNGYVSKTYDSNNNLIETASIAKGGDEIDIKFSNGKTDIVSMSEFEIVEIPAAKQVEVPNITIQSSVVPSGFSYVGQYRLELDGQLGWKYMKVYYDDQYDGIKTYSIRNWSGTIGALVLGMITGLGVGAVIAHAIIGALIGSGLGVFTGDLLGISSSVSLACYAYSQILYTEDSSEPYRYRVTKDYGGTKYIVGDIDHPGLIDDVYYEGTSVGAFNDYYYALMDPTIYHTYGNLGQFN